ncbi:MAG: hypothetical protein WBF21_15545, partial [Steroidobacteraceae bacterium]
GMSSFALACLLCAGCLISLGAQGQTSTDGCVKTRCFTPSCFRYTPGGYYMQCPDGSRHLIVQKPEQESSEHKPVEGAISPRDAAGDWEVRLEMGTVSRLMAVLRLRLDKSGALTGSIETLMPAPQRVPLSDVKIEGKTLSYTTSANSEFQGTFSDDGKSIVRTTGGLTWQRARTLEQAQAADAKESP